MPRQISSRAASRELDGPEARRLLAVLDDERCAALLGALADADDPLTVNELSERCDIPLSTVYRKIDDFLEVELVEEHTELRDDGKHTSSYATTLDGVHVDLTPDGLTVTVHHDTTEETEVSRTDRAARSRVPVRQ